MPDWIAKGYANTEESAEALRILFEEALPTLPVLTREAVTETCRAYGKGTSLEVGLREHMEHALQRYLEHLARDPLGRGFKYFNIVLERDWVELQAVFEPFITPLPVFRMEDGYAAPRTGDFPLAADPLPSAQPRSSSKTATERLQCKRCGEYLVSATTEKGHMNEQDLVLFFKMIGQRDPLPDYLCGKCGSSSFELVQRSSSPEETRPSRIIDRADLQRLQQLRDVDGLSLVALDITSESEVRQAAWRALEELGELVMAFAKGLEDADPAVRGTMATNLSYTNDARAVEYLIGALQDDDDGVRWSAVMSLNRIGDARSLQPLIGCLVDRDERVRREAAEALGKLGKPEAVPFLITSLGDKDLLVRKYSAKALEQIGGPAAERALLQVPKEVS